MPYASKDKRSEYGSKYCAEHYARLALTLPSTDTNYIRNAAKEAGLSYSQYVLQAVREKVARDTENHNR